MRCLVTGMETNNKWKGFPVCKEAVQLARIMEGQNGFLHTTVRERLQILQQRWIDRVKEEADGKPFDNETKDMFVTLMKKVKAFTEGK